MHYHPEPHFFNKNKLASDYFIGLSEKRESLLGLFGVFAYSPDHIFMRLLTTLHFYHILLLNI